MRVCTVRTGASHKLRPRKMCLRMGKVSSLHNGGNNAGYRHDDQQQRPGKYLTNLLHYFF